jgi:hypothetical protein
MKTIEDYLVETTISEIKSGTPVRVYYQGNGDAGDKKASLITNPIFSEPIDGEVEALCNFPDHYVYGVFPSRLEHPKAPIRFDRKDALGCDIYINIDNCDLDSDSFNINEFRFIIYSDGITLSCSLYPPTVPKFLDDLDWKSYGHNHHVRNIPIVLDLIKSVWNFLKGDKPIWEANDKYSIITEKNIQIWKTVIRMILNSEYTILHQRLLDDYIAELENLLDEMEEYEQGRTVGYINITRMRRISANDTTASVALRLEFFDILTECNKLELLRQTPLEKRLKMIKLFNKLNKHEVVALLNHYHKGDYRSLDTMEGWEL